MDLRRCDEYIYYIFTKISVRLWTTHRFFFVFNGLICFLCGNIYSEQINIICIEFQYFSSIHRYLLVSQSIKPSTHLFGIVIFYGMLNALAYFVDKQCFKCTHNTNSVKCFPNIWNRAKSKKRNNIKEVNAVWIDWWHIHRIKIEN